MKRGAAAAVNVAHLDDITAVRRRFPVLDARIGAKNLVARIPVSRLVRGVIVLGQRFPLGIEDAQDRIQLRIQRPGGNLKRETLPLLGLEGVVIHGPGSIENAGDGRGQGKVLGRRAEFAAFVDGGCLRSSAWRLATTGISLALTMTAFNGFPARLGSGSQ